MTFDLQDLLFPAAPSRRRLLGYRAALPPQYTVQVFRNHSFELVANAMAAYLEYAQLGVRFVYSGYDDSLSFAELDRAADAVLVWVDAGRYRQTDTAGFLRQRVAALRGQYDGPILIAAVDAALDAQLPGVVCFDLAPLRQRLGADFFDLRTQDAAGTRLSSAAMLAAARALGLTYLPALLRPALKAVVVDFDNTLYAGVLGEDGIDGVRLTDGHRQLQQQLKELAGKGIFLCGASKNEYQDVIELLARRQDFPLKESDFTKLCISWAPKTDSLAEIVRCLNIHPDSILFVDDNIGELSAVQFAYPDIKLVHAKEDAAVTCAVLAEYPGLALSGGGAEARLRKSDVQANEARRALARQAADKTAYIRSLDIRLGFYRNSPEQAARIVELANKTNQFIFSYARYTAQQMAGLYANANYAVIGITLQDRLSDSGLIGVCVGRKAEGYAELEECYVSCRALGRGIEDIIVLGAVQQMLLALGETRLRVRFCSGARNQPAERFVQEHLARYTAAPEAFAYTIPSGLVTAESFGM